MSAELAVPGFFERGGGGGGGGGGAVSNFRKYVV